MLDSGRNLERLDRTGKTHVVYSHWTGLAVSDTDHVLEVGEKNDVNLGSIARRPVDGRFRHCRSIIQWLGSLGNQRDDLIYSSQMACESVQLPLSVPLTQFLPDNCCLRMYRSGSRPMTHVTNDSQLRFTAQQVNACHWRT